MGQPDQLPLAPLSYHTDTVRYLQTQEPDLWTWFSTDRLRQQQNDAVRMELLKATYRIERDANPSLYAVLDDTAARLALGNPVTLYQSQNAGLLNAGLSYMPGEAHVVLSGPVATTLTEIELRSVLGHELAHFCLLERWGDYLVASQLLAAMTNDSQAQPAHAHSARLFQLYTEVFCDRVSHLVTGDLNSVITALVKMETNTTDVSAESYLRQAAEIFQKGHPRTEGITHPEPFIRVRALELWATQPEAPATALDQVIEGPPSIEALDLLGQQKLSDLTRRLITAFLRPDWLRTDAVLAHAKLFFDDFRPSPAEDASLSQAMSACTDKTRDYYCYVLLDFVAADRDLEEAPLAAALLLSDVLGLGERFRQLAAKELNLRKKQLEALDAKASQIVAKAREATD